MTKQALIAAAVLGLSGTALLSLDTQKSVCADSSVAIAYAALLKEAKPASVTAAEPVANLELPNDGRQWHTIYVFDERRYTDPVQRQLSVWFATDPQLQRLAAQTVLHVYDPTSQRFSYFKSKGPLPQVCVVRDDSEVAYHATADKLPQTVEQLVAAIATGLKQIKPPAKKEATVPAHAAPAQSVPPAVETKPTPIPMPVVPEDTKPATPTTSRTRGAVQRTLPPVYRSG